MLGSSGIANGDVPLDFAYGGSMQLQNDWDELAIADAKGILVDRLAWDNGRTFPDPDGASMSLIDPERRQRHWRRVVRGDVELGRR